MIQKLEALLRRIPSTHPKRAKVSEHLAKQMAGLKGEQSLNYFYRYLPQSEVSFLHGIRIFHNDYFFQMDTLILTPCFFLILEIKNYSGHLYFDNNYAQLIRTLDDKVEVFDCPIKQVKRQASSFSEVLEQNKVQKVPIESLVIMSNPKVYIQTSPQHKEALTKVIRSSMLESKFFELTQKYNDEILSTKEIKKVIRTLKKLHQSYNPDICALYDINEDELVWGVPCPTCKEGLMDYSGGSWKCPTCNARSKTIHKEVLKDYALLVSTKITNQECRQLLNLSSSSISFKLLTSLKLPHSGSNKGRHYHLDSLIDQSF